MLTCRKNENNETTKNSEVRIETQGAWLPSRFAIYLTIQEDMLKTQVFFFQRCREMSAMQQIKSK